MSAAKRLNREPLTVAPNSLPTPPEQEIGASTHITESRMPNRTLEGDVDDPSDAALAQSGKPAKSGEPSEDSLGYHHPHPAKPRSVVPALDHRHRDRVDSYKEGRGAQVHPRPVSGKNRSVDRRPIPVNKRIEVHASALVPGIGSEKGIDSGTPKTMTRSTVSLKDSQPGMSGPGLPGARGGGSLPTSAKFRTRTGTSNQNRFCADCTQVRPGATSSCAG